MDEFDIRLLEIDDGAIEGELLIGGRVGPGW